MAILVEDFINKFRTLMGDTADGISDQLLIEALNLSIQKIVSVPKLGKAFKKHYNITLNAKDGYKWKLDGDFRRLSDIPVMNFLTIGEGGNPCKLHLCPLDEVTFYEKHGVPSLKEAGIPCDYTLEQEGDNVFLVFDRPLDVPLMVDYIAYGYPEPVTKLDDKVEISAPVENAILQSMREAIYIEAEDLAFAGTAIDILSNKYLPELTQQLYHRFGLEPFTILGEA